MHTAVALMPSRDALDKPKTTPNEKGFLQTFSNHLSAAKNHFFYSALTGTAIALAFNGLDNTIVRRQTNTAIAQLPKKWPEKLIHLSEIQGKGLSTAIAKQVILNTSLLFSMVLLQDLAEDLCGEGPVSKMLAGMGAGAFQAYVSNPLSTILVRMQTDAEALKAGTYLNCKQLLAGASATAARNGLFWSLFLASTQALEGKFDKIVPDSSVPAMVTPVLCGLASSAVTAPIATVSNCQRKSGDNFTKALSTLVQTRGLRGLYAGAGLGMLRMVGVSSLTHCSAGKSESFNSTASVPPEHEAEWIISALTS
ncbi:MAG: hypothetical protein K0R66_808 [Gammaproteobacteria bacterium]|jgi:hypothetical protein|nr:hypothetical protein [Gammaproteobacteria bacterium]